jgi:hypothetical protein
LIVIPAQAGIQVFSKLQLMDFRLRGNDDNLSMGTNYYHNQQYLKVPMDLSHGYTTDRY